MVDLVVLRGVPPAVDQAVVDRWQMFELFWSAAGARNEDIDPCLVERAFEGLPESVKARFVIGWSLYTPWSGIAWIVYGAFEVYGH